MSATALLQQQLRKPTPTGDGSNPFALLAQVIAEGQKELGDPYAGPLSDFPDSSRFDGPGPHDGWDCSSFVAGMYERATGGAVKLTAFTDAIAAETLPIDAASVQQGDIVLWRYADPAQSGVKYPHVSLWLDGTKVLDCRYMRGGGGGVGIWPMLNAPYDLHRVPGLVKEPGPAADEGYFSATQIASVLGSPLRNVQQYWPLIQSALADAGIADRASIVGALGTIGVECPVFAPIEEYGPEPYWDNYDGGAAYHGRGFIQLTHLYNYRNYGQELGLPLAAQPQLALDPGIAARLFAAYFKNNGLAGCAAAGDWYELRCRVNGRPPNGYPKFLGVVQALLALPGT